MPVFHSKRSKLLFLSCTLIAAAAGIQWRLQYNRAHHSLQTAILRNPYPHSGSHVDRMEFSADGRDIILNDISDSLSVWSVARNQWTFWLEHGARSTDEHVPTDAQPFLNSHAPKMSGFPPPLPKYPSKYPFDLKVADYSPKLLITSPSKNFVAYVRADNFISVADISHKRILFSTAPAKVEAGGSDYLDKPCTVCFSPDEETLAVASIHCTGINSTPSDQFFVQITLLHVQTGKIIRQWTWDKFQFMPVYNLGANLGTMALSFSPDGQRLAISDDRQISLWDISSASLIQSLQSNLSYGMTKQLIFFRKRPLLASSGWGDEIQIWNIKDGTLAQVFHGPSSTDLMALSPDERLLASNGQDSAGKAVLQVWDVSKL